MQVETELSKRDLTALPTPQLMIAAPELRRQIELATGPLEFSTPLSDIPAAELHEQAQHWSA